MKWLGAGLILLLSAAASAHPLAPALLQLHEIAPARYDVLWRTSVTRTQQLDVTPVLPGECLPLQAPEVATEAGDAVVARWRVQCDAQGLLHRVIGVQGLAQSGINVILHLTALDGRVTQALLGPEQPSFVVTTRQAQPPVFQSYLRLGIKHLLTGLDHLMLVAGLWLLVRGARRLLLTLTAFTLGHSLTLVLASLGLIQVNQAVAELGIALSILWLATEMAKPQSRPGSLFAHRPWLVAAGVGLLHGLGFAGALAEVGLPQGDIVSALIAFNIGIEAGQLLWVAALVLLAGAIRRASELSSYQRPVAWPQLPAYCIGAIAACWCYQRGAAMLV